MDTSTSIQNQTNTSSQTEGLGFSRRNLNVQVEEQIGEVVFKVISNDGSNENLILLTNLKNIISKQLPKMPKEYIVRLVFDRKHESIVLMKGKSKVIGGVCYRTNLKEKFIEIAFLAISHTEQVKGYGTRIMNKLKDHCKEKGIEFFLTYADNNAIGYFKKQGFSNLIKCPIENWKDLIKDYDGGTLMEATIKSNINYGDLSNNLTKQREFLFEASKRFLSVKRERSIDDLRNLLKNHQNYEKTGVIPERLFNLIPGIIESRWDYRVDYLSNIKNENKLDFIFQCRGIINKIRDERISQPFHLPVNKDLVTDYYEIIKDPMDLHTLELNLDSGCYKNKESFVFDLMKIFKNAKIYNKPSTFYYKSARDLESIIENDIKSLSDS